MKKIRLIAAATLVGTALTMSCSALSVLFNIPTVYTGSEYASITGRTVEEVLNTVETSAKEQLYGTGAAQQPVVNVPTAPVVNNTPVIVPAPTITYYTPSADGAVSGSNVTVTYVNGIPMISMK